MYFIEEPKASTNYNYTIVIDPEGMGHEYVISDAEIGKRMEPTESFQCKLTSRNYHRTLTDFVNESGELSKNFLDSKNLESADLARMLAQLNAPIGC